ncbi:MAG TPA: hypothetical protein VHS58_19095 [Acetobacteraceae bacterium]|nr:hypothetical protein [Acetobacteraceae bacterium]
MIRIGLGIAAIAMCTAASPPTTFVIARTAGADAVSRFESSTTQAPSHGFTAAPVPNTDLNAPGPTNQAQPSLAPSLFTNKDTYRGEGFVSGSTAQTAQFQRAHPGVGGTLSVPIQ